MTDDAQFKATPAEMLERRIMDPCVSKSEAEWWARAEIERLREALEDIARGDYSDPMCERTPEQRARAALEGGQ